MLEQKLLTQTWNIANTNLMASNSGFLFFVLFVAYSSLFETLTRLRTDMWNSRPVCFGSVPGVFSSWKPQDLLKALPQSSQI